MLPVESSALHSSPAPVLKDNGQIIFMGKIYIISRLTVAGTDIDTTSENLQTNKKLILDLLNKAHASAKDEKSDIGKTFLTSKKITIQDTSSSSKMKITCTSIAGLVKGFFVSNDGKVEEDKTPSSEGPSSKNDDSNLDTSSPKMKKKNINSSIELEEIEKEEKDNKETEEVLHPKKEDISRKGPSSTSISERNAEEDEKLEDSVKASNIDHHIEIELNDEGVSKFYDILHERWDALEKTNPSSNIQKKPIPDTSLKNKWLVIAKLLNNMVSKLKGVTFENGQNSALCGTLHMELTRTSTKMKRYSETRDPLLDFQQSLKDAMTNLLQLLNAAGHQKENRAHISKKNADPLPYPWNPFMFPDDADEDTPNYDNGTVLL